MHKTIEFIFASAVATSGTFTVSYPSGTNKASFLKGVDHRLVALQKEMLAPEDFTIAFGDTEATITYNGTTTIPVGSRGVMQLDMAKSNNVLDTDFAALESHGVEPSKVVRIQLGNPDLGDLDLLIDSATGAELPDASAATSKTYTASTSGTSPQDNASRPSTVTIGGELCYDLSFARNLQAKQTAGSGNTVASTITINGYDEYQQPMTETLTMPLTATSITVTGVKAFRYVRSFVIYSAADITGETIEVGTGDALGLPIFIGHQSEIVAEYVNDTRLGQYSNPIRLPFEQNATKYAAGTSVWTEPAPVAGAVQKLVVAVQDATTGAGAVTAEIGGTAVDGIAISVTTGATVGTVFSDIATAGHASTALAAGTCVEITGDATPSAGSISGYVLVEPTTPLRGTLVTGSRVTPSASSADVRGTYTPEATLDGSKAISLDVLVDNPSYLGGTQYTA